MPLGQICTIKCVQMLLQRIKDPSTRSTHHNNISHRVKKEKLLVTRKRTLSYVLGHFCAIFVSSTLWEELRKNS